MLRVKSPQDLGAALTMLVIGGCGLWFGADYDMGTGSAMGPGYMPRLLSYALVAFGLIVGLRAFTFEGPPVTTTRWRPLALILLSIVAFAMMIRTTGLLPTAFAVTVVAALGSFESRWRETLMLAAGMAIFCVLVFVYGLGQAIPVIGSD